MNGVLTTEDYPPLPLLSSFQTDSSAAWFLRSKILITVAGFLIGLLIVVLVYLTTSCFAFIFLPGGFFLHPFLSKTKDQRALVDWRKQAMAQLLARPAKTEGAFAPDLELQETARFLGLLAKKDAGWPQSRFLPWDPVESILTTPDGLTTVAIFSELAKMYNISFGPSEVTSALQNNWGDFVYTVYQKVHFAEDSS
jgi:hypothetical protein